MMKYLGIDYGGKRIGLAISDVGGTIAFPRSTIENDASALKSIVAMVKDGAIGHIVVGDTRSHNGAKNPVTTQAESFIESLAHETDVPISRALELFSSVEASRYAPEGSGHDDSAAAAFILQRFLDMKPAGVE